MSVNGKLLNTEFLIALMLSLCFLCVCPAVAQTDQTVIELQSVNIAVGRAFSAVLDAEKAGANVTSLLSQLNDAADQLAQAENAYRTGDSAVASNKADAALSIALQVTFDAQTAKQTALVSTQNAFWLTIAFTAVGIIMFLEILFLAWVWFKRNYIKNLSEAKPELVSNE